MIFERWTTLHICVKLVLGTFYFYVFLLLCRTLREVEEVSGSWSLSHIRTFEHRGTFYFDQFSMFYKNFQGHGRSLYWIVD